MEIVIYFFAASFVFMAVALIITYRRTRHYGVFLLGLTYAASAVLAVVITHWWPLVAGFVLVWVLRFLGLDPDVQKNDAEQSTKE
jgi:hypothetical protein